MKKEIAVILLSSAMVMGLCACDKSPEQTTGVIPTKQPVDMDDIIETPTQGPTKDPTQEPTKEPQKEKIESIRMISGQGYVNEWDEDTYTTVLEVTYPFISVYYDDVEKYSTLYNALSEANDFHRDSQLSQLELSKDAAYTQYETLPEGIFAAHEFSLGVNVRRADSKVVSLLYDGYNYEGGRQGDYYYWSENYDSKTGKKLSLEDVVTDQTIIPNMIQEQLNKFWDMVTLHEDLDLEKILKDGEGFFWTLDNHGLTFYFNSYVIAPYTKGVQIVTLSNEEYPELLKDEYKECLPSYGVELTKDTPFYYDVTGDGKVDEILCSWYEGFEGEAGGFSIYINGEEFSNEYYAYDTTLTFVHMETGENLLSVECLWENDYKDTTIYKLGNNVERVDCVDVYMRRVFHENPEMYMTREVLVDPSTFCMSVRTNMLSTVTGYAEYAFGTSLLPERKKKMLAFDEESIYTLTLLQDMKADFYDEVSGNVKGEVQLLKGDKVQYYSTDNEQYVYLMLEDGTSVRKEIVQEEWMWCIDGIWVENLFEGMFFAG